MYIGNGHLSDHDAERFADGVMGDAELCEADNHQANCDDCHNLVNAKSELANARREAIAAEMGDVQIGPEDLIWPEDDEDRRLRDEVRREERDNEEDLRRDE
jgi:hypothetical protein